MRLPRLLSIAKFVAVLSVLTAGSLSAQPVITAILDGAALTSNIAQGSVFIVKGTGLSNANEYFQATAPAYPTTFHNVSMTLIPFNGGTSVPLLMVYVYNINGVNQLAGVLPSTVPVGSYNLQVKNGSNSSFPFGFSVVARKPGIVTADGSGVGIAQATLQGQLILQRNSNVGKIDVYDTQPAHPNDIMTLWGTGLGADTLSDAGGSSGDQTDTGNIRVVLNGSDIKPIYAGRSSGYPGLDQVNFSIPANVALGCSNTVQVRVTGGILSNVTTIATAAAGSDTCPVVNNNGTGACPARATGGSTNPIQTQAEINEWAASGQYCTGSFSVSRLISYTTDYIANPSAPATTITKKDYSNAGFSKVTGSDLTALLNGSAQVSQQAPAPGVCNVFPISIVNPYPNLTYTYLNAGNSLTVSGPNGSKSLAPVPNSIGQIQYNVDTGAGVPGNWMDPGTYTFTGPGSPSVGSFTAISVVSPEFIVTNASSLNTVTKASGLTVTWTGGDPTSLVYISGTSYVTNAGVLTGGSFQCYASNSAGTFTVPGSLLQQFPASATTTSGPISFITPGSLGVSTINKITRTPVTGIDYFTVTNSYNYAFNPVYK